MPLKELPFFVPYDECIIGIYEEDKRDPVEEFSITDIDKMREYADADVTSIWILDEDTLAAAAFVPEED